MSALPERVKWTIKPPLCKMGDGKFADCIYIDADGTEIRYCSLDYARVLAIESARLYQNCQTVGHAYRNDVCMKCTHKADPPTMGSSK